MICPNCQKQIDDDAIFCNYCGAEIPSSPDNKVWNIGRDDDNDIVQDYLMISGHHYRIIRDGNHFAIQDLESTNGTYLNGRKLSPFQKCPINPDDAICIGSHKLSPDILSPIFSDAQADFQATSPVHDRTRRITKRTHFSIGRGLENDIVLDFPQVSREHAWLIRDNEKWIIEDRQSSNHIYINDRSKRISRKEITPEDILFFGSYKISAKRAFWE